MATPTTNTNTRPTMAFRTSVRQAAHLRVLLLGMTKSGKSYTACAVAHHLAEALGVPSSQIGVIESEVIGERDKIRSRFELNTGEACACMRCDRRGVKFEGHQVLMLDTPDRTPEGYCEAIRLAKDAGFPILVIDSISHEWDACLAEKDRLTSIKNEAARWLVVTPKHEAFLRALTTYPGHVIATCRTKDKTIIPEGGGKPQSAGEQPWQRDGIEYEFDVAMRMSGASGRCSSRSDMLNGRSWEKPGGDFADLLLRWASVGETATREREAAGSAEVVGLLEKIRLRLLDLDDDAAEKGRAYVEQHRTDAKALAKLLARIEAKATTPAPTTKAEPAAAPAPTETPAPATPPADEGDLPPMES